MNQRVSPDILLPLSVVEPAPKLELPPLAQTAVAESQVLPTLKLINPNTKPAELPTLSVATLVKPAELQSFDKIAAAPTILDSLILTKPDLAAEPASEPKVVKSSALKPAVRISQVATTNARAKLTVKKAVPKYTERFKSLQLKERGIKFGRIALTSVSKQFTKQVNNHVERKLLFKPVTGSSWAFDLSNDKKENQKSSQLVLPKLQETENVTPVKESNITKIRTNVLSFLINSKNSLDETLYARKSILGGAIGVVALAGTAAWLSQKGFDFTPDSPQLVEAGDAVNSTDPSATTIDASERIISPGKPVVLVDALDQTPATPGQTTESLRDLFVVDGGEGIVENIMDDLSENGVEISASDAYEFYQEQDAKLDGQLITGDTYRMPNGDLGISHAGQFGWQQEMQNALEEIAKEKKKKKS